MGRAPGDRPDRRDGTDEEGSPAPGVRPATAADVDVIVALVESAYRGDASRAGWTTEAHLLDGRRTDAVEVAGILARHDSAILLAEAGGAVLGCCHVERREAGVAYFGMFAVRPDRQARGTGTALLARAEDHAVRAWDAGSMELTVIRQRLDLVAWYERRGYRSTGRTLPFPYGDERFGRPRVDDLAFAVLAKDLAS